MKKLRYVYWQDEDVWLGYLIEFPDDLMQGETRKALEEGLIEAYRALADDTRFFHRNVGEIELS